MLSKIANIAKYILATDPAKKKNSLPILASNPVEKKNSLAANTVEEKKTQLPLALSNEKQRDNCIFAINLKVYEPQKKNKDL